MVQHIGLQLEDENGDVVAAARDAGLLTVPAGANVVRVLPPLNISDEDLAEGVARLDAAMQAVKAKAGAAA